MLPDYLNEEQSEDCASSFALAKQPCEACGTTALAKGEQYCDLCHDDMAREWNDTGPTDEELDAWADFWAEKDIACENPF